MAILMALAFMLLSVPVVSSALGLANSLASDSRVKTDILRDQYCSLGVMEYVRYLGQDTTRWLDFLASGEDTVYMCGQMSVSVGLLGGPPGDLPLFSSSSRRMFATKEVDPTSISPGGTVEYTIIVENKHRKKIKLMRIVDELPLGFTYQPSSTTLIGPDGLLVPIWDLDLDLDEDDGTLEWTIPGGPFMLPGQTATLTFRATAATDPGVYCNDVHAFQGGKRTRSGKTARVTVFPASPDDLCQAPAVSVFKTVDPEVLFGTTGVSTFNYSIEIINESDQALTVKEIKDFMAPEFTYVPYSTTSSPAYLMPNNEPNLKTTTKGGQVFNEIKWKFKHEDLKAVPPGVTWLLEFQATTLDLPVGYYPNEVDVRFDKSQMTIFPTAGPVEVDDEDIYTYVVPIENDGTEILTVKEIKVTMLEGFDYVADSTSSTPLELHPGEPQINPGQNEIKWTLGGGGTGVPPGAIWLVQFQVATGLPEGEFPFAVKLKLEEHVDDVKPRDRTTGPTAIITVVDQYEITISGPGGDFTCNAWIVPDIDVGTFIELQGCVI